MKLKLTNGHKLLAVLALVVVGQTLAFDDEVKAQERNCSYIAYSVDNQLICEEK